MKKRKSIEQVLAKWKRGYISAYKKYRVSKNWVKFMIEHIPE